MRSRCLLLWCAFLFSSLVGWGQHPSVPPQLRYERLIAVVPMVGAGTYADPKRPLGTPAPADSARAKATRDTVFAFSYQLSDDQQFALVEYVATKREHFAGLLADKRVVKAFERGKSKKDDIEKELKKYKKDFTFDRFGLGVN